MNETGNAAAHDSARWYLEPALVAAVAVHTATRVIFLLIKPAAAVSADVEAWARVAAAMRAGENPYVTTNILVHPPFGMQLVFLIDRISTWSGLSFANAFWAVLVLTETILLVVCLCVLHRWHTARVSAVVVLVGITLQPAMLFSACMHGNIDLFVGLFVVLAVSELLRFAQEDEPRHYRKACIWLGMGILVKTVPLILAPLLLVGAERSRWRQVLIGGAIMLLPVSLGMAALWAFTPVDALLNILRYRSYSGYFGISGLLQQWNWARITGVEVDVRNAFPFAAVLMMLAGAVWMLRWRAPNRDGRLIILLAMIMLLSVPTLGSGYAPQYIGWWWPLAVISATLFGRGWMLCCAVLWVIVAATYAVEYGLFPSHGALFLRFSEETWLRHSSWADRISTPDRQTWIRLPLFVAQLFVLIHGAFLLRLGRLAAIATNAEAPRGKMPA